MSQRSTMRNMFALLTSRGATSTAFRLTPTMEVSLTWERRSSVGFGRKPVRTAQVDVGSPKIEVPGPRRPPRWVWSRIASLVAASAGWVKTGAAPCDSLLTTSLSALLVVARGASAWRAVFNGAARGRRTTEGAWRAGRRVPSVGRCAARRGRLKADRPAAGPGASRLGGRPQQRHR